MGVTVSISVAPEEPQLVFCHAPHPGWDRAARFRGRTHMAVLPIRPPAGIRLELVRLLPEGANLTDVRQGLWGVQCSHRDCKRVHEFRIA